MNAGAQTHDERIQLFGTKFASLFWSGSFLMLDGRQDSMSFLKYRLITKK
jgi:hypothetical protein